MYRVLLVAMLVTLAGCSTFGGGQQTPTATITPAEVPEDTRDSLATQPLPPDGLNNQTIVDVNRLASAHRAALTNTSYTIVERQVIVVRDSGEPIRRTTIVEQTWVGNATAYRHDITRRVHSIPDNTTTRYNGTEYATDGSWWMVTHDGTTRDRLEGKPPVDANHYAGLSSQAVTRYLSLQNTSVTRFGDNESSRYLVEGTGLNYPEPTFAYNYSSRAVVRQSGQVDRLWATYTETISGNHYQTTYQFEVRDIGSTTVPEPTWMENETASDP